MRAPNRVLPSNMDLHVEVLGIPPTVAALQLYAQNIWDLQTFDGKVFIGYGNSSFQDPGKNSGPLPVTYYDPATEAFGTMNGLEDVTAKTSLDEQQLDTIKVLNGDMYFLSMDAKDSTASFTNFYRLQPGETTWTKYKNIPKGLHIFDMAYFNGRLFACGYMDIPYVDGDWTTFGSQVWMSADDGATWTAIGAIRDDIESGYAFGFFELNGKLYATVEYDFLSNDIASGETWLTFVMQINADFTHIGDVPISQTNLFPGTFIHKEEDLRYEAFQTIMIKRAHNFLGKSVYIAGVMFNDVQMYAESLVILTSLTQGQNAVFPEPAAIPTDILIRGEWLYVCTFIKTNLRRFVTVVYRTMDLVTWEEVTRFNYNAMIRAMEELNGDLYFGTGSYIKYMPTNIGTILRVKNAIKD
jgi:hypothetical protein